MAKRYKKFKWAQIILFSLAVISCIIPVIVAAFKIGVTVKTTESKFALGGVAVFFCAIIIIIVFRSLVGKFISKLPFTLSVLISIGALLLLMLGLKYIIDDAISILCVGLIGAFAGFCFEAASMICKAQAEEAKEIYLRGAGNNV